MSRILLFADSDTNLCLGYREYFAAREFDVETAQDGLECVAKLREVKPDVLVVESDLRWGGGDGVLARIAQEPEIPIPIVILTHAGERDNSGPTAFEGLIFAILQKPCPADDLHHTIISGMTVVHAVMSDERSNTE